MNLLLGIIIFSHFRSCKSLLSRLKLIIGLTIICLCKITSALQQKRGLYQLVELRIYVQVTVKIGVLYHRGIRQPILQPIK